MNELTRMQYMDALGIAMYVPRYVLPAAKPPIQAPLPVAEAEAETVQHFDDAAPVAKVAADTRLAEPVVERQQKPVKADHLLSQLRESAEPKPEQDAVAQEPQTATQSDTQDVRFALSIWRAGESVMVLDSRRPQAALPTQSLLKNIFASKNLSLNGSKPEIINWPMFGGTSGPQGWSAASEMVLAFLKARMERQASQFLWVMGKSAYAAIYGSPDQYEQHLGKITSLESLGVELVVLPSLSEMIEQPALKRTTWLAIRDTQFT